MVTSGKRFILKQDKKNSAVTQLTDNVTKPISIPSSLQQEKEIPAGVQKIIQNQPGTPNGSISAPDKSNRQIRLEYQKQQMANKAKKAGEKIVSNTASLLESAGAEIEAAAATKFTMNAAEVEEAARREAGLVEVENRQAQEGKPRVESEFGRMVGDTSKLQEPFKLKLGFSPSPFKTGYLNFLGDEVSLTNGTSSITKPVIKTIDYESVLGQAYDTITYKAANEQEIMTVESFDELFPEYKDVPYDQKQIFINECLYDVQQGKKRDINEFADFFGSMSMKEGYVNQQDATIQYLTDSDVAKYSLNAFIGGTEALEGRTPEQIRDYIEAAYTIKAYADEINKQGYNVTDSAGWTIVKSFADDFEDLNQAIKTFENFNLTNTEAYQINNLYKKNLRTQNELVNDFVYGNEIEQRNALKQFEDQYLQQFHKDYISSFIREVTWDYQKDMEQYGSSDWNELMMWLYQDYYELDGKYYNKDGEEILPSEGRDGFLNKVADGFIGLASEVETLGFDTAIAQKAWKEGDAERERTMDVLFDTVNVAFSGMMEFTGGGQLFQFATTLGRAGAQLDWLFSKTMEGLGSIAEGLADMIGFTDGWSKDSKEKYKQAMEGIGIMLLGRLKNHMVKKGKTELLKYLDDTAMMKALKAYVAQTAEGLEVRDGGKVKDVIKNKGKTEEKKGEPNTRKEVEERAKEEKKTEEIKTEDTTQKGKITMKQGTQENALRSFREIFDSEIEKINTAGESPKLVDSLFQAASSLVDRLFTREKETPKTTETPEIASDVPVDGKTEAATPETVEKKTTPEQETIESTPEAPGIVVEEASTTRPEELEGTAEVREPDNVKETKTTISKILDVIQSIQDNAKELINETRKKIEQRKADKEIERNKRYFLEKDFEEGDVRVMQDNANSDILLRLIDKLTTNRDKKGKEIDENLSEKEKEKKTVQITKKGEIEGEKVTKDLIEREILSEGLIRIQKYTDRLNQFRKMIGKLYDKLSKTHNIDSSEFATSEPLTNLLNNYGLKLEVRYDENGKPFKADVSRTDGQKLLGKSKDIAGYVEHFLNDVLNFDILSEYELYDSRSELKWNKNTYQNYDAGFENSMRNAFNEFIDSRPETEMLRTLDKAYSELKDNLDVLSDLFKQGELKDNAKNKILSRDKETLEQMNKVLPGIKDLVELAKFGPSIVKRGIDAKTTYKKTHKLLGSTARLLLIGGGLAIKGTMGFVAGSVIRATAEALAVRGKRKIQGKKPDRETWNKMYDTLKVEGNTKAKLKQDTLKRYEELSDQFRGETEKRINEIIQGAIQKITERRADEIMEEKRLQDEMNLENWNRSQQPINNALPGIKPDIATAEGEITLGIGNPINPETLGSKGVKQQPKPIKEVKETYRDKDKTQQGYTMGEQLIIEAAIGGENKTYDPKVEKVADILEAQIKQTADVVRESAINSLEEKGETITEENIAKEIQREPSSIEEFIIEAEKGAPEETTNYDGADIKDLEEVVANPKKYPNVDIEAAKSALEKARRQNRKASVMQSPDQIKAQTEKAGVYKADQMEKEHNSGWEGQKEETVRDTNRDPDALETTEEYDRIDKQLTPENGELATKYSKGYKGFYRADKDQTDKLRADMGKKPSQNITYTSSADKIATLENPTSRKRVAQQRIDQKVDPNIKNAKTDKTRQRWEEEKTQLTQIIEQSNVEIQAKEERKAQKTELANKYKALEKKRSETPYRETKKEITKEMNKISKEFDKVEMEEWEAEREISKMEYEENMEIEKDVSEIENETPQTTEVEIEDKKEIDRKERELEAKTVSTIRKSSIDEGIQEAIDKGVAEEKKEMTELIKSGKIDKGKKYEMVVERKYNKFGDTVERGDIKPIEIDLENAPDALFELAKYVEKGNNISLKYWNGNNKNIIRSTQGRGETTNIEGFKKRYENNKTLSEETNKQGKETKTDKLSMDDLKGDAPIEIKNKVTEILNDTTDNIVENIQKGKSVKETSDKNIYGQEVPKDIKDRAGEGVLKNNKGELVPIFHGSNSKFTIEEFDENRAVSGLGGTNGGFGMFFAIRYEYAEGAGKFITDRKKGETNVMECYSNIKNPILHPQYIVEKLSRNPEVADTLLMDYYKKVGRMDYLDEIHDFAESEGYESLVDALGDKLLMEGDQWRNAEFRGDTVKERKMLQKLGYDSIIFSEENFTIAIFDPKKNVKQTNQKTGKNKGGDKPEEPTTPKKPEPTKPQSPKGNMMANVKLSEEYGERKNGEAARPGDGPLLFVENDGTIRSVDEPGLGDIPTYKIQTRIDFLKQKRADNGKKLYAKELSELKFLQDLLKRQIKWEGREKQGDITDEDYVKAYETGGGGVDKAPF